MSTELELKFSMPAHFLPAVVALLPQLGVLQHSEQHALLNAYFDTADNWFRRHDMGLRSRLKRGQFEQTIKLAGTQHGAMQMRPEYNLPCATVRPELQAFPSEIWPQHTNIASLQQQLTELFRTDFNRQSWQLACADGSLIELVYDEGQIVADGRCQSIAELELELLQGDANQLFVLATRLLQQIPLRTGWQSKAARGYRLRAQQAVPLPDSIPASLLGQINALQQAEACYEQQPATAALTVAAQLLYALADSLTAAALTHAQLQHAGAQAAELAAQLAQGQPVFAQPAYQQLLLSVSHYLYQHG